jgi:hypothetical protein
LEAVNRNVVTTTIPTALGDTVSVTGPLAVGGGVEGDGPVGDWMIRSCAHMAQSRLRRRQVPMPGEWRIGIPIAMPLVEYQCCRCRA